MYVRLVQCRIVEWNWRRVEWSCSVTVTVRMLVGGECDDGATSTCSSDGGKCSFSFLYFDDGRLFVFTCSAGWWENCWFSCVALANGKIVGFSYQCIVS